MHLNIDMIFKSSSIAPGDIPISESLSMLDRDLEGARIATAACMALHLFKLD